MKANHSMPRSLDILLTMDDVPVHAELPRNYTWTGIHQKLSHAFRRHRLPPVIGYVNGAQLYGRDQKQALAAWIAGGEQLGNHTYSHQRPEGMGASAYLNDIRQNEEMINQFRRLQKHRSPWQTFRYPFLDEGNDKSLKQTIIDGLRALQLVALPVTISFHDWYWNRVYYECVKRKDSKAVLDLEELFLTWSEMTVQHFLLLQDRDCIGPHIVALHVGAFEARIMSKWIDRLQKVGVSFVDENAAIDELGVVHTAQAPHKRPPPMPYDLLCHLAQKNILEDPKSMLPAPIPKSVKS